MTVRECPGAPLYFNYAYHEEMLREAILQVASALP